MSDIVSIIIPAYNVETYVRTAVESCLKQTYHNIEIIVVDDGSTDRTFDVVQELSKCDDRIKLFNKENGGVSSARNLGLKNSTGKYVLFLDSDDWLETNAVETLLNYSWNSNKLVACDRKWVTKKVDGSEDVVNPKFGSESPVSISREEAVACFLTGSYSVQSACYKLFNRQIITDNHIRFDEDISHGEDGLFVYEYLYHTDGLKYIPERLWNILERPGSASRGGFNPNMISMLDAIDKMITYGTVSDTVSYSLNKYFVKRSVALISSIAKRNVAHNNKYIGIVRNKMKERINKTTLCNDSIIAKTRYAYYLYAPIKLIGFTSSLISSLKQILKSILYR